MLYMSLSAGQGTMATRMKLKLKTVFVLYFMVSLLGLVYALMQLGEWVSIAVMNNDPENIDQCHRQNVIMPKWASSEVETVSQMKIHFVSWTALFVVSLKVSAVTAQSTTCLKTVLYLGCEESCIVFKSRWESQRRPNSPRNNQSSPPYPPSLSSPQHTQGRPPYYIPQSLSRFIPSLLHYCTTPFTHKCPDSIIFVCHVQAGAKSWADSFVPDIPPSSSASLDCGRGLAS